MTACDELRLSAARFKKLYMMRRAETLRDEPGVRIATLAQYRRAVQIACRLERREVKGDIQL